MFDWIARMFTVGVPVSSVRVNYRTSVDGLIDSSVIEYTRKARREGNRPLAAVVIFLVFPLPPASLNIWDGLTPQGNA
jgi:hypothetical protein